MTHPSPTRQYLPNDITTACPGPVRLRSPRMIAPLEIMVFPPKMMFCGPAIVALRETLLPVSFMCVLYRSWIQIDSPHCFNELCFRVVNWCVHLASCRRNARVNSETIIQGDRPPTSKLPITMTLALSQALCRRTLLYRALSGTSSVIYVRQLSSQIPQQHLKDRIPSSYTTSLQSFPSRCISTSSPATQQPTQSDSPHQVAYHGPLAQTFRRLKIFSLSSLALSCIMTPFIFIVESSLPISARIVLATTALTTSGVSTALVGWSGYPYVVDLRRLTPAENGGIEGIEMTTLTLMLRRLTTRIYDADFLVETRRPFAKWELAEEIQLPSSSEEPVMAAKAGAPGQVETVAETLNAKNEVVGRWVVKWGEGGAGSCKAVGKVVR